MQELDQTGSNWIGELVQTAKTSSYQFLCMSSIV